MNQAKITPGEFAKIIKSICQRDTSSQPDSWSENNPLLGHCAVASLLAQDYFGGSLVRQPLKDITGFENSSSHYLNRLPNGEEIDFTAEQFKEILPDNLPKEERSREYVLSFPDTRRRYELLKSRFNKAYGEKGIAIGNRN